MIPVKNNAAVLKQQFSATLSTVITDRVNGLIHRGIAIAYSGGLDSAVLLSLVIEFCREKDIPVFAFHIHHGLSPNADSWLNHCKLVCEQANICFEAKEVYVNKEGKDGIESAARTARYSALGKLCLHYQLPLILTAHHQDDQAETLLLQLLRGSGVSGLSGMDPFNHAPALLGTNDVLLARPLLGQTKSALLSYAEKNAIKYIEDESNFDLRYVRNALRHEVMPVLSKISKNYTACLARSAQHLQAANRLLLELAQLDLIKCKQDDALDIEKMREIGKDRVNNLLRFWLSGLGVRMPSTARLAEMRSQLFDARDDAQVTIYHDQLGIHRYKNKIYAAPMSLKESASIDTVEFFWSGEDVIYFPAFSGSLYFEPATYGVNENWLKQQKLNLRMREGGERLKLAPNRSTRDIKSHFQALKIPFWQRQRLPFLYVENQLLHAACVGTNAELCEIDADKSVNFRWQAD